jgi:hypothetical protein
VPRSAIRARRSRRVIDPPCAVGAGAGGVPGQHLREDRSVQLSRWLTAGLPVLRGGPGVPCVDVAGLVKVLLGLGVQAVALLQRGEGAEVAGGFGGFRAVAVIDGDSPAECFHGCGVPVRCCKGAGCPAQLPGQPDIPGPERFFRGGHHLLAVGERSCRVTRRQGIIGEPAQLG